MSLVSVAADANTAFDRIPIMRVAELSSAFLITDLYDVPSDLIDVESSDPSKRRALANEVREACMSSGFFYGNSTSMNITRTRKSSHDLGSKESWHPRQYYSKSSGSRGKVLLFTSRVQTEGKSLC
jgi:hypothetical protein